MPANEPAAGGAAPGGEGGRAAVLTDAQLAEIERMLSRVSEWPWEEVELDPGDYRVMGRRRGNYRPCVADVMQSEHDSAFIAEAPAYVSALLATVRALRDELEEARREREKAKDAEAHFAILAECRRNDLRVADELLAAWKGAITDAGVVAWTLRPEHEHDPRAAVNALLAHAQQVALDPAVSSEARDLHDRLASAERAAREAGEREQALRESLKAAWVDHAAGCTACEPHRMDADYTCRFWRAAPHLLARPAAADGEGRA